MKNREEDVDGLMVNLCKHAKGELPSDSMVLSRSDAHTIINEVSRFITEHNEDLERMERAAGTVEALNEAIAETREALGEFNSESVVVMARRAAEEISRLRAGKEPCPHGSTYGECRGCPPWRVCDPPSSGREAELQGEIDRLTSLINTPHTHDFVEAVLLEMPHQRERWGAEHDAGKTPADWFWLVGYLAGKALHALVSGNIEKAKHHVITTAAALGNWFLAITGESTSMRPGIDPPVAVASETK